MAITNYWELFHTYDYVITMHYDIALITYATFFQQFLSNLFQFFTYKKYK